MRATRAACRATAFEDAMPDPSPFVLGPMDRGYVVNRRSRALYRAFHAPANVPPRRLWVFCNALLEDATFGFRVFVELADAVVARGDAALRFDAEGQGDSEGEAQGLGLDAWIDDTVDAVAHARERFGDGPELVLVSLGSGSLVAAAAAERVGADRLLLIEPVLEGERWFDKLLKGHTTMQLSCHNRVRTSPAELTAQLERDEPVSLHGQEVGRAFADSLRGARLAPLLAARQGPTDVIGVARAGRPGVSQDVLALAAMPRVAVHTCEVAAFLDKGLRFWELPPPLTQLCLSVVAGAAQ